ncbi:conserved hypothetical protein [Vibrio phage 277E43-1]|nr:conserved hypothetical protein [Vibrio phage 277E43-1]
MDKLLSGLESEKKWVDNHPEFYDNSKHQEQVKHNIEIRYRLGEMLNKLNKVC